ncbi:MAG: gamma-glutamyl-gamma-aminobutyrate hydrolase family protein [Planctomycetota bacterium]|jgi:putative glutamine amidotransferase
MRLPRWLKKTLASIAIFAALVVGGLLALRWWAEHGAEPGAPRIGLSVSDAWYDDLGFHRVPYDVALARAGAQVVTIRPSDHADRPDEALDGLDAILLAGGGDIDPKLYGGGSDSVSLVDVKRDRFELELLEHSARRGLPVVGICRGIQVLAVAHGGDLRDLREEEELAGTHGISVRSASAHDVLVAPGTRLAGIIGATRHRVNSTHFHAVANPGRLDVCARSPDGVVEAVELPGDRLVLGIQWHPELLGVLDETQQAIIEHLVAAATAYRRAREQGD